MNERRFIEEHFPVSEIGELASKEKYISHGHIQTLHPWWARRPLTASRATIYASLIKEPKDIKNLEEIKKFIIDLSKWKNSLNENLMTKARKDISKTFNGKKPKILDPFAGGGSIPLESLRLGCETYANDYNPVAALINKCIVEYSQKFHDDNSNSNELRTQKINKLKEDLVKWSNWIYDKTSNELGEFYPHNDDEGLVGFIWARTIKCPNPICHAEIPLLRQFWLVKNKKKQIAIKPIIKKNHLSFTIVGTGFGEIPGNFDPNKGTIGSSICTCLLCKYTIDKKNTSKIFKNNQNGEKLLVVITNQKGKSGKRYRIANKNDEEIYQKSGECLKKKINQLKKKSDYSPIPDELTPDGNGKGAERGFTIRNYGFNEWGQLFNMRQKLAMICFVEQIHNVYEEIKKEKVEENYAKCIVTFLALLVSRLSNRLSTIAYWYVPGEKIQPTFVRQALSVTWDFVEMNPFNNSSGGWRNNVSDGIKVIEHLSSILKNPGIVTNNSATSMPYPDEFFDAIITDPPYYDNVPYSHLSDYFYVWLKRMLGKLYPDFFATPLTPKSKEIVLYGNLEGGWEQGKDFFEKMLSQSFSEINRMLKPDGISVIVYAHKSTEGWERLIYSLLHSGLIITASWPIYTEMKSRVRSREAASLLSSIYLIVRKSKKEPTGFYREVKQELKKYLDKKLAQLWNEGISGADFFISAIGSAIEVFGKYEKVVDDSDNQIPVSKLLDDTREIVTNYAIQKVLRSEFSDEISQMTRFYILWRWALGEVKVPYNDALKLAQSTGIDERELNKGFLLKEKEYVRVLGPDERKEEELEESHELIDVLHHTLILWKKNKKEELEKLLQEKGYDKSDMFKRVAQAISESLSQESTEKKWLDGFLTGFRVDDSQSGVQTKLI